jgi:glycosyltransferase involved in cell wall biosynthesis
MRNRIFIADSVCAFSYGHNPVGVRAFSDALQKAFPQVIPLVSRELPTSVNMPPDTDRIFQFYYRDKINLPNKRKNNLTQLLSKVTAHPSVRKTRELAIANLHLPLIKDPTRAKARSDWRRVFKKYEIAKNDVIFFPCGDYYSVRGLFHFLQNLPITEWPSIHLHLIHVMENECAKGAGGATAMFGDILATGLVGHRISLSAEMPAYAKKLSNLLFTDVAHFAFPPCLEFEPFREKPFFQVSAIGSGRGDKGYFRLAAIAETYASRYKGSNVRFAIQSMNATNRDYNKDYQARLIRLANVDLLPAQLGDAQMFDLYTSSDLLLLPYCKKTYRFRGSAVMSEGYAYGRPLLVTAGTAFEEIVHRFGNGTACSNDIEFVDAIYHHSQTPKDVMSNATQQARASFFADYEQTMKGIRNRLLNPKTLPSTMKTEILTS